MNRAGAARRQVVTRLQHSGHTVVVPTGPRPETTMPTLDFLRHEPEVRECAPGETIFRAGDAADCMYAVIEGEVEILIDGRVIERLASGGVFGEMALIDVIPRSATAMVPAGIATRLAVISEKRFLRMVAQTPQFAIDVMRLLTERLRRKNAH